MPYNVMVLQEKCKPADGADDGNFVGRCNIVGRPSSDCAANWKGGSADGQGRLSNNKPVLKLPFRNRFS